MPYSYTNRKDKTYYVRAVVNKKGTTRYYITTKENSEGLINKIPEGFEIVEKPEEGQVIIRKIIPLKVTIKEQQLLQKIIGDLSALKDFFIHAEGYVLTLYYSQFNHIGGSMLGENNLSREEAKAYFGESTMQFIRFLDGFRMILIDEEERLFRAERIVNMSYFGFDYHPISTKGKLEDLANKIAPHLGTENWFRIAPLGYDTPDDILI